MNAHETPPAGRVTYWTTRLLTPDDDQAMARLSRLCFGERADTIEFIRSRYTNSQGPRAYVMAGEAGGELIGTQAVTMLPFWWGGREIIGGMFTAGMTHPQHRRRGVFREVVEACEKFAWEQGAAFLFTMPNDESYPSFQKSAAWHCLADRRLRVFPLAVGRLLRDRGLPALVAGGVGVVADLPFAGRRLGRATAAREVADLAPFASGLDGLARRQGERSAGIACRRDYAYLRWRFAENPTFRYRYFVHPDGAGLGGFMVTSSEARMRTTLAHVIDWVADGPEALAGLLTAAAGAMRAQGATLLTLIASGGVEQDRFGRFGFVRVPKRLAPRSFHTAVCPGRSASPDLAAAMLDDRHWYLTLGDFDTI